MTMEWRDGRGGFSLTLDPRTGDIKIKTIEVGFTIFQGVLVINHQGQFLHPLVIN